MQAAATIDSEVPLPRKPLRNQPIQRSNDQDSSSGEIAQSISSAIHTTSSGDDEYLTKTTSMIPKPCLSSGKVSKSDDMLLASISSETARDVTNRRRSKVPVEKAVNILGSSEGETPSKPDKTPSARGNQHRRKRSIIPVVRTDTNSPRGIDASEKDNSSDVDASASSNSSDIKRSSEYGSTMVSCSPVPPNSVSLNNDCWASRGLEPTYNGLIEYEMSDYESSEDSDNEGSSSPKVIPSKENGYESGASVKLDTPKQLVESVLQARIQELEEIIDQQKQDLGESSKNLCSLNDRLHCLDCEFKVVERRAKNFETDAKRYKKEASQLQLTLERNTAKEKSLSQKIMDLCKINREINVSSKQSVISPNEVAVHLQKIQDRIIDSTKNLSDNDQRENITSRELTAIPKLPNNQDSKNIPSIKPWLVALDAAVDDLNGRLSQERQDILHMKKASDEQICKLRVEVKLLHDKLKNEVDREQELCAMNEQLNLLQKELQEKEVIIADREKANECLKESHEELVKKLAEKADFEEELIDGVTELEETIEMLTEEKELLLEKSEEILKKLEDTARELEKNKTNHRPSSENTFGELQRELCEKEKEQTDGVSDLKETIEVLTEEKELPTQKNEELLEKLTDFQNKPEKNKANLNNPRETELSNSMGNHQEVQSILKSIDNTIQDLSKGLSVKDDVIQKLTVKNNQYVERLVDTEFQLKKSSALIEKLQNKMDFVQQDCNNVHQQKLVSKDQQISRLTFENHNLMNKLSETENKLKNELYKNSSVRDRKIETLTAEKDDLLKLLSELDEQLRNARTNNMDCEFKSKRKLSTKDKVIDCLKTERQGLIGVIRGLEDKNRNLKEKVIGLQQELLLAEDRPVKIVNVYKRRKENTDENHVASSRKNTGY